MSFFLNFLPYIGPLFGAGIAGAPMAVPSLVCLKMICDNVDRLRTLGNFLGAETAPDARISVAT